MSRPDKITASESAAREGIATLLRHLGVDPRTEGMRHTPERVVKAFREMTIGYARDPKAILAKMFDIGPENADQIVVVRRIGFTSLCEHHALPFMGKCHVGYLPGAKVVGLSKIPRLVECYAQRFQVQERMVAQIADAMMENVGARGVGVVAVAQHSCMACRGVRDTDAEMVSSVVRGEFHKNAAARSEFLRLIGEL